jgi:TrmH family RNA methyltransferase
MITSVSNAKVKLVRSLSRRRARYATRQFVVEGVRNVEEAQRAGLTPALAFYTGPVENEPRARALLQGLAARTHEVFEVSDQVMRAMSNTETPPGILAVFPFVELPVPDAPGLLLVLDGVRDPGNAGTILRAAWAAGVDLIICAPGTADPYNDKVVRAAMGAHFNVPLRVASGWDDIAATLQGMPRVYLADVQGGLPYTQVDWSRPVTLIVGGEAEGASDRARALTTARVTIPMHHGAESLNAAMAAAVLLFQAAQF